MKKLFTLFLASFFLMFFQHTMNAQTVLARWNFEVADVSGTAATEPTFTTGSAVADSGDMTAGSSVTALHASAATVWSTPSGNGSANSLSSNNWAVDDYYQFTFATTGYSDLKIQWDQTASSTGPAYFKVQYSTDGTNFTDLPGGAYSLKYTYLSKPISWSSSINNDTSTFSFDLSGISGLDNQAAVYIRLVDTSTVSYGGATVGTGGSNRVDNFIVSGTVATVVVPGPEVGDYGSAGTGNWGSDGSNWVVCVTAGTWDGATAATSTTSATTNVWIRSGHTVTVDASGKKCNNLVVESGATLVGDLPLPTSSIRYVRIYGPLALLNGTIGAPDPGNNVAFEFFGNVTVKGSGSINPARFRPGSSITDATLTFDCNVKMMYNGSSGSGGAAIYTSNSSNDNITITVNEGRTITFADYAYLGTSSSTTSDGSANTVFNFNGSVIQEGVSASTTLRVAAGKTCALNIGANGLLSVSKNFNASGGAGTTTITNDGKLELGTGGNGIVDFSDPNIYVGGTGTTNVDAGATLKIGAPAGLDPVAGPVRTTTRKFDKDCKYDYLGTAAQETGADLPSTVYQLSINNTAGVTLSAPVMVSDTGSIASGASLVETGTNYVKGVMKTTQTVGKTTSSLAGLGVDLAAGSDSLGNVTVVRTSGKAPAGKFTPIKRNWNITSEFAPAAGRDLTFNWPAGDDNNVDLTKAIVYKSTDSGANWTTVTDANGTDVSATHQITASGVTSFSDWTVAMSEYTPPVDTNNITLLDSLKMNDADGNPVRLNDTVNTAGIVTSIAQIGTGTSGPGTIQNENTAITVYGSTFTQTPGIQIGDSVIISNWKVTSYKGLTELSYTNTSSVKIVSSGHNLKPAVVTMSQINGEAWNGFEKYEGMYVKINNVHFGQTGTFDIGNSTGVNFKIYDGKDSLDFRIVKNDSSLMGKDIPTGIVNVTGIIQQYKSASPFDSGYEIVPLDSTGIELNNIVAIDSIKTNDKNGVSVMVNDTVGTTGIVTSILQLGTGASGPGTIQNEKTGVAVYGSTFAKAPGIQMGDSVLITNFKVTNYNGLTELSYTSTSTVTILSSGHKVTPKVVTIPDIKNQAWDGLEEYESKLVQINGVHFVQTGEFSLNGSSGYNYQIVNGTDTLDFRLVRNDSSLIGKTIPGGTVNIAGIIQQYSSSAPYNSGYEIFPLDSSSIEIVNAVNSEPNKVYTFNLYQNYPNPFNPSTMIRFELPMSQKVELSVYDILGRKVATLFSGVAQQGVTSVNFNASNLASGVYIYTIRTANSVITKKLMLLK